MVRRKLEEIRECWQDLESTTQAKARQLFEANKADLLVQSYESLHQRLGQLEGQLAYVDQGQDLTTVNKQLKKLQVHPHVTPPPGKNHFPKDFILLNLWKEHRDHCYMMLFLP